MRAGRLRNKVTLQRRAETRNAVGEIEVAYVDVLDAWASIEPILGREYFAAQQVQADVTTRIRVRYMPEAQPTMRIKFVSDYGSPEVVDYYDIEGVQPVNERRQETILMCRKRYVDGFRG